MTVVCRYTCTSTVQLNCTSKLAKSALALFDDKVCCWFVDVIPPYQCKQSAKQPSQGLDGEKY